MGNLPFDAKVIYRIWISCFSMYGLPICIYIVAYSVIVICVCASLLQDEEVYQLFCGIKDLESSIEAFRVIRDPQHNVGKGFAYVLFKTRVRYLFLCYL